MNYFNLTDIKELVFSLPRTNLYTEDVISFEGCFKPIIISNFEITLCASKNNFCFPRQDFESLKQYELIQIQIEENLIKSNQKALITPFSDERFSYFNWINYFCFQYGKRKNASYIGNYVPIEVCFQIIKDVNKLTKLRPFL